MVHDVPDDPVDEVPTLVTDQLNGATEDVFIWKQFCWGSGAFMERLHHNLFGVVVCGHNDISVPCVQMDIWTVTQSWGLI